MSTVEPSVSRIRRSAIVSAFLVLGTTIGLASNSLAPRVTLAYATEVTCTEQVAPVTPEAIERVMAIAKVKFAQLADKSVKDLPFGAPDGTATMQTTRPRGWTSGFFPATAWLLYQHDGSAEWLARARRLTATVLPVATWKGSHDLGFMVGLPSSLGIQLDPNMKNRSAYRKAMLTAAKSLSSRWNPKVGAFKSGEYDGQWGLIMDSAMNAPLLITRGQQVGGAQGAELQRRGTEHLLTLARTFVRPNGSTYHRVAFDATTGEVIGPVAGQGASPESTWARGQAWAIYGFAQGAALTDNATLKSAAQATADYWLSKVPNGCIPAWDLSIDTPNALHDSSASAIAANGLLLLADLTPDQTKASTYRTAALTTLGALATETWTPSVTSNPGLLQGQTYNVPKFAYEGSYSWGDTYLLQGLQAARRLVMP